jgi:hypothetical protein
MPGFPLNWYYWFGFIPLFLLYGAGTITRKGPIALIGAAWMAIATGFGWFNLYVSDAAMGMCIVIAIGLGILMWISEMQPNHTVGGVKTMQITLVILIFSLLTAMFSYTGAFPNVNTAAASSIDRAALDQLTTSQTISSDDPSGYAGLFIQGVKILFTIGQVILGTLVVAIPLMNMGLPWWLALGVVQPLLYALAFYDLLPLWRGIQWN